MLRKKISQEDAIQWWIEKDRITPESEILIDWKLSKSVMQEAPRTMKTFIAKWVTNQLPVGILQVIRNFQSSATCPRCRYCRFFKIRNFALSFLFEFQNKINHLLHHSIDKVVTTTATIAYWYRK